MNIKLILVVILIIGIAGGASVLFYKQAQQDMEEIRILEGKIKTISTERIIMAKEIKEAKDMKQALQQTLDSCNQKVNLLKTDISKTNQEKNRLLEELLIKERQILRLEDKLDSVIQQESELNAQLEEAKSDYQTTVQKIETTRKEKMELEKKIKSRLPSEAVELKKIVVKTTPVLEGEIIEVNKEFNFAIINLGAKDNLNSGSLFGIYREGQLMAKAVAENIYEDMSSIIILDEWIEVPIVNGDTVRLLKP